MNSIVICHPDIDTLHEAVSIHQSELSYTLNSILGHDHLCYLYSELTDDENSFVGVAKENGFVVGIISGSIVPEKITKRIFSRYPFKGWLNSLMVIFRHPSLLKQVYESQDVNKPVIWDGKIIIPVLSTIAVSPQVRGRGVGRALIHALEDYFRYTGVNCYRVDTLITNSARTFYIKNGFIEVTQRSGSVIMIKEIVDVESWV
jgi:ribosomal protein S18 acetylase RimI-like enzyme